MRTVRTYERFQRNIRAWADGELGCLLVVGPAGMGKTHAYEEMLGNRPCHRFGGRASAFHCFCELQDRRHLPVIFDDVSGTLRNREFLDFMKQLCVMRPFKNVSWRTATPLLGDRKTDFITASKVLVVLNELPPKNEDLRAILDRLDGIEFDPTRAEVLARMREIWPRDGRLIDRIENLPFMPSLRTLKKARRWYRSKHLDVDEELLAEAGVSESIQQLVRIRRMHPKDQWRTRYMELTGRSQRSYRRDKHSADRLVPKSSGRQSASLPATCVPRDDGANLQEPGHLAASPPRAESD